MMNITTLLLPIPIILAGIILVVQVVKFNSVADRDCTPSGRFDADHCEQLRLDNAKYRSSST